MTNNHSDSVIQRFNVSKERADKLQDIYENVDGCVFCSMQETFKHCNNINEVAIVAFFAGLTSQEQVQIPHSPGDSSNNVNTEPS